MRRQQNSLPFGEVVVGAVIGAICGGMLASVGNLISSSTLMVVATIIGAGVLGGWLSSFWGAVNGSILGGMGTTVGGMIGGSALGVMCTICTCALLGGWMRWRSQERGHDCPPQPTGELSVESPHRDVFVVRWHAVCNALRPSSFHHA